MLIEIKTFFLIHNQLYSVLGVIRLSKFIQKLGGGNNEKPINIPLLPNYKLDKLKYLFTFTKRKPYKSILRFIQRVYKLV